MPSSPQSAGIFGLRLKLSHYCVHHFSAMLKFLAPAGRAVRYRQAGLASLVPRFMSGDSSSTGRGESKRVINIPLNWVRAPPCCDYSSFSCAHQCLCGIHAAESTLFHQDPAHPIARNMRSLTCSTLNDSCGSQAQTIAKAQSPWNSELLSIMNKSGASVSILHAEGTGKENLERRNITISGSSEATSSASVMVIPILWHIACVILEPT